MKKNMPCYSILEDRGVVAVSGPDARSFLQAMISNDASKISPKVAIYAALLTPQGKFLHDFIISQNGDEFLLDTEKHRVPDLLERLQLFRLGSNISINAKSNGLLVAALWSTNDSFLLRKNARPGDTLCLHHCSVILDPRLAALGYRVIGQEKDIEAFLSSKLAADPTRADYDIHRLEQGVPDGSRDIQVNKSFLLESNFEELNGISFDKGCYIGQENTARQKYRGTIRRRLVRVNISGPPPDNNETITWENGEIGQMRSVNKNYGIAIIRLDQWAEGKAQNATFQAGLATVDPVLPEWMPTHKR